METWSEETGLGNALETPGVVFTDGGGVVGGKRK
ncbi:hypothetical protein S7335_4121 [Synechococcus sp. PCC 7335]|nr:hypothetical protein S7335_4121 [Synechococcus sp. PCC 7335]